MSEIPRERPKSNPLEAAPEKGPENASEILRNDIVGKVVNGVCRVFEHAQGQTYRDIPMHQLIDIVLESENIAKDKRAELIEPILSALKGEQKVPGLQEQLRKEEERRAKESHE
ncbi:hypothetical protein A3B35_02905 [Candidatus Kaiserbacteria bacterium RIFCSPLOWO2_01_FULL_54_24]|uniref:Uncharacterized protein n=1 Tax=Candidatus Kaiserbacteria bacterium RIFCSPLOWO2_01_FULL_54_24 TaxID=1798515 RepID=A0A1F6EUF5_9BACT|nr:MAG: hypothetical protein A3B35_02905 [Candidatus Kaiserbacteria bacterium RIFCSPLOWO2_01_FULL_54_24]